MILPTKHLTTNRSLLGVGAEIIHLLDHPKTISRLWTDFQEVQGERSNRLTFDWFILSLNLLYAIDAIEMAQGRLSKRRER